MRAAGRIVSMALALVHGNAANSQLVDGLRLVLRPRLALGEAYVDGALTVEDGGDIYDLLDLLGRNMPALEATPPVWWSYSLQRWLRILEQYNPIGQG